MTALKLPKRGRTALFIVLACLPCCLPLLAVAGGSFLAAGGAWVAGGLLLLGAFGTAVLWRRRRRPATGERTPQPLTLHEEWARPVVTKQ